MKDAAPPDSPSETRLRTTGYGCRANGVGFEVGLRESGLMFGVLGLKLGVLGLGLSA